MIRVCGDQRIQVRKTAVLGLICAALIVLSPIASAQATPGVLQAWLSFPDVGEVEWPYAYLRFRTTQSMQNSRREDLFAEFKRLSWRLENGRHQSFMGAIDQWRAQLEAQTSYREPGDWSPAWLMAHPHRSPPLSNVAAIGACPAPAWVEVWDSTGIERIPWRGGLRISDLARHGGPLQLRGVDQVALVTPEGAVRHYGQAAYNYSDVEVIPGTRVVAALPLSGDAFPWIRDAIANLLAHSPVETACREMKIVQDAS